MNAHTQIRPLSPVMDDAELARVVVMHTGRHEQQRLRTIAQVTALRNKADVMLAAMLHDREVGLHYSSEGHALVNAMYDLTELDALYDMAVQIGHDAGVEAGL